MNLTRRRRRRPQTPGSHHRYLVHRNCRLELAAAFPALRPAFAAAAAAAHALSAAAAAARTGAALRARRAMGRPWPPKPRRRGSIMLR